MCDPSTEILLGCTNPFASNYDPAANYNDGSCLFVSGCTIDGSDNYNPDAVIDDGSCYCGESNILFSISGQTGFTLTEEIGEECSYVYSFDFLLGIDCGDVLSFYAEHDLTLNDILGNITVSLVVLNASGDTIMDRQLYQNDPLDSPFQLSGDTEMCDAINCVLEQENGIGCVTLTGSTPTWKTFNVLLDDITVGETVSFFLNLKGLPFDHEIYIDNVSLDKVCVQTYDECNVIPKVYGFDLEKTHGDKYGSPDGIVNSKEMVLRVNPYQYIEQDTVDFLNSKKVFLGNDMYRQLTIEKMAEMPVQKSLCLYNYYLKGDCTKGLWYDYAFEINSKLNPVWYDTLKKVVPSGSIWENGKYLYKNMLFHEQGYDIEPEQCLEYDEVIIEDVCDGCVTRDQPPLQQ